jgi:hypothetical protein
MQTDIEVDEVLLADALAATGLETFRDVVELGLRMLITLNRPEETRGFPEASVPEVCLEGTGMEIVTTHLDPPTERAETIFEMLAEEEWISARAAPEGVAGWQQLGWIFGVEAASQLTLPDTSSMSAISRGRSSKRFWRNSAPLQTRGRLTPVVSLSQRLDRRGWWCRSDRAKECARQPPRGP